MQIIGAAFKPLTRHFLRLKKELSDSQNASRGGLLQEQDTLQMQHTCQENWMPPAEPLMMICIDASVASCPLNAWYGRPSASSLKSMPGPFTVSKEQGVLFLLTRPLPLLLLVQRHWYHGSHGGVQMRLVWSNSYQTSKLFYFINKTNETSHVMLILKWFNLENTVSADSSIWTNFSKCFFTHRYKARNADVYQPHLFFTRMQLTQIFSISQCLRVTQTTVLKSHLHISLLTKGNWIV